MTNRNHPTTRVFRSDNRLAESYRAVVEWPDGKKTWLRRPTQEAAAAAAKALVLAVQSGRRTVELAIEEYIRLRMDHGAWAAQTERRARLDLADLVPEPHITLISEVDRATLLEYLERTKHLSLGSRKSRWGSIVGFLQFCVSELWLERNPTELIDRVRKPWVGKRAKRLLSRGKTQLANSDEVQRYISAALQLVDTEERVAALLPLLCNLRSGEVLHLTAADIDLQLGVLHVRDADARDNDDDGWAVKSVAGRRIVYIPDLLRQDLETLITGQAAGHLLLGNWGRERGDRRRRVPHKCHWLAALVERVCRTAQVREVKPHGLRGTYMTVLSVIGKVAPMDIARLVGHGDAGVTARRHYIGGLAPEPALPDLAPNLPGISPDTSAPHENAK